MPHFIFKSKKGNGEVHKGEKDAKDRYDLYKILKESGEEVISVQEQKKFDLFRDFSLPFMNSVKMRDKINFARNLGAMIKAGLAMSQALSVMERQGSSAVAKKIIGTLNEEIRKGKTLSEAMGMFPNMFSSLVVAMVRSGEQSGTLGESLRIVTLQMEKTYQLQRRVRGALMYPSVIFSVMILVGIVLFVYVVPTLMKTFGDLKLSLPLSTRIVVGISQLVQNHGLIILGVLLVSVSVLYTWSKRPSGRAFLHKVVIKIPLIGSLVKEVNVARTARTLSSLVSSDVDLMDSLRITSEIIQNIYYRRVIYRAVTSVEKGEPLSKTFSENQDLYPVFFSEMITVGEETGKIGEMLLGVATYFEDEIDQKTKDMSTIIEPFLMVIIGAAVGFFAVAMISPMYSLVNTI